MPVDNLFVLNVWIHIHADIVCQVTKLTNLVNVLSKLALLSTAEYVFLVQVIFVCYANKDFS